MTAADLLGPSDVARTADAIAAVQLDSGLIPHYPGGPADPWNHVEAAMALDVAARHGAARAAYTFLFTHQRADGSLPARFANGAHPGTSDTDTNAVAYLATGCLHHLASTGDRDFVSRAAPAVGAAIDFVLAHQRTDGAIAWSVGPDADDAALLAASSAIYLSLGTAIALGELVGAERPDWIARREALRQAIRDEGAGRFLDKSAFAMDWYYPVLVGALDADDARRRLAARWRAFVAGDGVRCRADERWVTSAETAECTLALARIGEIGRARALFATLADKRQASGGYLTGLVYPERSEFPPGEATTYSAAAVLLAADALAGGAATSLVFTPVATSTRRLAQPAASSSTKRPDPIASR
jgi:hypothetical protein